MIAKRSTILSCGWTSPGTGCGVYIISRYLFCSCGKADAAREDGFFLDERAPWPECKPTKNNAVTSNGSDPPSAVVNGGLGYDTNAIQTSTPAGAPRRRTSVPDTPGM